MNERDRRIEQGSAMARTGNTAPGAAAADPPGSRMHGPAPLKAALGDRCTASSGHGQASLDAECNTPSDTFHTCAQCPPGGNRRAGEQLHGDRPCSAPQSLVHAVSDLLAWEALRFFGHQLALRGLPGVPQPIARGLWHTAAKAVAAGSLGEVNALAWHAVREAARAARADPPQAGTAVSMRAADRWKRLLSAMPDGRGGQTTLYSISLFAPTWLTWSLFRTVLGLDPLSATRAELESRILELTGKFPAS